MQISGFENKDYRNGFDEGYDKGRADLIKEFDESSYMIIHVKEYGEYQPCCYSLHDILDQLKEKQNEVH